MLKKYITNSGRSLRMIQEITPALYAGGWRNTSKVDQRGYGSSIG